jgi:transcriptional regulator with XRE-family HTH domain
MARPSKQQDLKTFVGRIGAEIRRRREERKLTVEQAAAKAGAPVPTWYHWESGSHLPLDRLPAIAKALRCTPRDLIPDQPSPKKRKPLPEFNPHAEGERFSKEMARKASKRIVEALATAKPARNRRARKPPA